MFANPGYYNNKYKIRDNIKSDAYGNNRCVHIFCCLVLIFIICTILITDISKAANRTTNEKAEAHEKIAGGGKLFVDMAKSLSRMANDDKSGTLRYESWGKNEALMRLASKQSHAYIGWSERTKREKIALAIRTSPNNPCPERTALGKIGTSIIVRNDCPIRCLSIQELRNILGRNNHNMHTTCKNTNHHYNCYSLGPTSLSFHVISDKVMRINNNRVTIYRLYRNNLKLRESQHSVIDEVRKNKNNLGIIPWSMNPLPKGVRTVQIVRGKGETGIIPSIETLSNETYPLTKEVSLFVRHGASPRIKRLKKICIKKQGANILVKYGLLTPYHEWKHHSNQRLNAMKAGKGQPVAISGSGEFSQFVDDLAVEFVKAKSVIRPQYAASGEVSAVGRFALGKTKILMLKNPPGKSAMKVHGQKWDKLWKNRKDKPGDPIRHVIPGRAVAVVVNAANKVTSLNRRQIHDIYRDEITDWRPLLPKPKDKQPDRPQRINTYGLPLHSPDARMFYEQIALPSDEARFAVKKNDAAILSALATDTDGIGFVNATALPDKPEEAGVKVLAIDADGSAVRPSAKTVLDKSYPLAERIYIYVHPEADEITRNFIEFIATCGRSADNPYVDVPESAAKAFKSHGLLPPPKKSVNSIASACRPQSWLICHDIE